MIVIFKKYNSLIDFVVFRAYSANTIELHKLKIET